MTSAEWSNSTFLFRLSSFIMALKGLTIALSAGLHPQLGFLSSQIQKVPFFPSSCSHLFSYFPFSMVGVTPQNFQNLAPTWSLVPQEVCFPTFPSQPFFLTFLFLSKGSMFVVAKKWGLSVVNERWLADCFKHKKKMDEQAYQHCHAAPKSPPSPSKPLHSVSPPRPMTRHEIDVSPKKIGSPGSKPQPCEPTLLFRGYCFVLVGYDKEDIEAVAETVERRGGRVMEWKNKESQHKGLAIVREYASSYLRPLGDKPEPFPLVTLSSVTRKGNQPPSSFLPSPSRSPSSCAVFLVSKHGKSTPKQAPKTVPVVTPQVFLFFNSIVSYLNFLVIVD